MNMDNKLKMVDDCDSAKKIPPGRSENGVGGKSAHVNSSSNLKSPFNSSSPSKYYSMLENSRHSQSQSSLNTSSFDTVLTTQSFVSCNGEDKNGTLISPNIGNVSGMTNKNGRGNGDVEEDEVLLYQLETEGTSELYAIQISKDDSGAERRYQYKVRETQNGQLEAIPDTIILQPDGLDGVYLGKDVPLNEKDVKNGNSTVKEFGAIVSKTGIMANLLQVSVVDSSVKEGRLSTPSTPIKTTPNSFDVANKVDKKPEKHFSATAINPAVPMNVVKSPNKLATFTSQIAAVTNAGISNEKRSPTNDLKMANYSPLYGPSTFSNSIKNTNEANLSLNQVQSGSNRSVMPNQKNLSEIEMELQRMFASEKVKKKASGVEVKREHGDIKKPNVNTHRQVPIEIFYDSNKSKTQTAQIAQQNMHMGMDKVDDKFKTEWSLLNKNVRLFTSTPLKLNIEKQSEFCKDKLHNEKPSESTLNLSANSVHDSGTVDLTDDDELLSDQIDKIIQQIDEPIKSSDKVEFLKATNANDDVFDLNGGGKVNKKYAQMKSYDDTLVDNSKNDKNRSDRSKIVHKRCVLCKRRFRSSILLKQHLYLHSFIENTVVPKYILNVLFTKRIASYAEHDAKKVKNRKNMKNVRHVKKSRCEKKRKILNVKKKANRSKHQSVTLKRQNKNSKKSPPKLEKKLRDQSNTILNKTKTESPNKLNNTTFSTGEIQANKSLRRSTLNKREFSEIIRNLDKTERNYSNNFDIFVNTASTLPNVTQSKSKVSNESTEKRKSIVATNNVKKKLNSSLNKIKPSDRRLKAKSQNIANDKGSVNEKKELKTIKRSTINTAEQVKPKAKLSPKPRKSVVVPKTTTSQQDQANEKDSLTCAICNKSFRQLIHLVEHRNTHNRYKCTQCDVQSSCQITFNKHMRTVHLHKTPSKRKLPLKPAEKRATTNAKKTKSNDKLQKSIGIVKTKQVANKNTDSKDRKSSCNNNAANNNDQIDTAQKQGVLKNTNSFVCLLCQKKFMLKKTYLLHMRNDHAKVVKIDGSDQIKHNITNVNVIRQAKSDLANASSATAPQPTITDTSKSAPTATTIKEPIIKPLMKKCDHCNKCYRVTHNCAALVPKPESSAPAATNPAQGSKWTQLSKKSYQTSKVAHGGINFTRTSARFFVKKS